MNICTSCGHENEAGVTVCVSCDKRLEKREDEKERSKRMETVEKKSTNSVKGFIFVTIIIILSIALFTAYQLLSKKYSAEVVIEQFESALAAKDEALLQDIIQPKDERLKIDEESLAALFTLLDSKPSILQEIIQDLNHFNIAGTFTLETDGKHFGIFDRYIVSANTYFLQLSDDTDDEVVLYVNDREIGTLDELESSREFGPYLAGSYVVKAINHTAKEKVEDSEVVTLFGEEAKVEVYFDTEYVDTDEVVKAEVIETAAFNDVYIIPNSDWVYLDEEDLIYLSSAELRIARNEIYARHGYVFDSEDLKVYFNQKGWYVPDPDYNGALSAVEEYNVELIKSLE